MHFVTGGAFNGKSAWVKEYYHIEKESGWFSGWHGNRLPQDLQPVSESVVVLEGIEYWIRELLKSHSAESVRALWREALHNWHQWEREKEERVVCLIGSDITKGIVPAAAEEREWRDTTGRIYQDTAALCERVDFIWYGISKRLK